MSQSRDAYIRDLRLYNPRWELVRLSTPQLARMWEQYCEVRPNSKQQLVKEAIASDEARVKARVEEMGKFKYEISNDPALPF